MSARAATSAARPFVVPKQIKALSSTFGVDPTAPHYAFIDDPLTIPSSNFAKRNYFLAKEFGKRAARQLASEWPTLFMFDRDQPRLPIFRPENLPALVDAEEPSEEILWKLVEGKQVWERLRAANTELSPAVIQELFNLAAFYNGQDPPPSETLEWPGVRNYFDDAETPWLKNAANFSTLISCKAKFGNPEARLEALQLLDQMEKKKLVPDEDAFINLIRVQEKPDAALKLLKRMAKLNVAPSIRTFNAVISCVSKVPDFEQRWKTVKELLAEARRLRLQPNLTTFGLVLSLVKAKREENQKMVLAVTTLNEILHALEKRPSIECEQFSDQEFFVTAMSVATFAANPDLVDRLHALYESPKNRVRLTAFTVEAVYYNRYLTYKIGFELTDVAKVGELYMSLVPRVVGVSRQLTNNVLRRLPAENPPWPLLKRVVEDGIAARQAVDLDLCRAFLRHLLSAMDLTEAEQFRVLVLRLHEIWLELANFVDERVRHRQVKLRPSLAVQTALLLLRAGEDQKAFLLLELLVQEDRERLFADRPQLPDLLGLFDAVMERGELQPASHCLELTARYYADAPLEQLAEKLGVRFGLTPTQRRVLHNFVRLRN